METATAENFQPRNFSIKFWPPSQSTRLMLVDRMTKHLSTESFFSRKYGLLAMEEASESAKQIEDRCFAAANEHFERESDGDGSSAVQVYAKETSKLMLEVLKKGPNLKEDKELAVGIGVEPRKAVVFDISGGQRAFIEAEAARELLSPLAEEGNSYTKIIFRNRSFGLEAAQVAEPILASLKGQLTEVDISDFVAGRPEDEALEVMRIFSSALEGSVLRYLNLSDNALGEKGVRAFGSLLKSQTCLEELYLMNDGISEEAAKALTELIPSTEKIRILHFHNNMTGDEGAPFIAEILKRSSSLEDFQCSSTRVGSEGGIAVAEALEGCDRLRKLDLTDNIFGVEAGLALSRTLRTLKGITELYLSYLNLEDEGAIAICDAVEKSLPFLEVFVICGNDITVMAAAKLASCVASKQSLKKLNLSENELKDEGAIAICDAVEKSLPSLEVFEIGENDITVKAAAKLASCVASKQSLKKLNLSGNELKDEGAVEIAKALQEGHRELKEVDLSSNMIRRVGARSLARAVASEKPEFMMLNINGNIISDEGIDEVKEILKEGVLGPLDGNDVEDEEDEEEEAEGEEENEVEAKLQDLTVDE